MKLPQATVKAKNFRHRHAFSSKRSNFSASLHGEGFPSETGEFYKFYERKELFVHYPYRWISEKMLLIQKNGFHEEKAGTEIPAFQRDATALDQA